MTNKKGLIMLDFAAIQNKVALPKAFYATSGNEKTSEKYQAIASYRIVHALEKAGFETVYASQARFRVRHNDGYQKHVAKFRHADYSGNNVLVPEIALANSANGSSTCNMIGGAYVFACTNGLFFGHDVSMHLKVTHRGADLTDRIIDAAFTLIANAKREASIVSEWQSIAMPYWRQLDFAERARALRYKPMAQDSGPDLWPVEIGDLLTCRHFEQRADNLFNVYNRIQEALIRGGMPSLSNKGKTRRARPIKAIEQDIAINQGLFELAKQYA